MPKYYPPKPRTRGYYTKRSKKTGMLRYKKPTVHAASVLQAAVRRAVTKQIGKVVETKTSCYSPTDGTQIYHNSYVDLNPFLLQTTQGTADPTTVNTNNRIGDQILLKGVSIKMMIELNERYSDVTFRILVIKCAKGDNILRTSIFNGLSGNKMLDTLNTERYTFLADKWVKLKAPNQTPVSSTGLNGEVALGTNAGIEYITDANQQALSRATKIVKLWIPGYKFNKSSIIKYEDNSSQPKFFDYHVAVYAYSNYTTAQDLWYVGRINDAVFQMYYKDA